MVILIENPNSQGYLVGWIVAMGSLPANSIAEQRTQLASLLSGLRERCEEMEIITERERGGPLPCSIHWVSSYICVPRVRNPARSTHG